MDGVQVGQHPIITRLMKGIYNRRPASRRLYPSWDAGKVISLLRDFPSPAPFHLLIRKTAFLIAMASTRRPSELASLRISPNFLSINSTSARFIPSQLSKTDKAGRMGKPIIIYRLSSDSSICPVTALEALIAERNKLNVPHDYLFCEEKAPYSRLSSSAFSHRLKLILSQAGIDAPPGSTRAMSTSAAFSGGVDIDAILRAGDWSGAEVFFRFYCRDLGVTPQGPPSLDE